MIEEFKQLLCGTRRSKREAIGYAQACQQTLERMKWFSDVADIQEAVKEELEEVVELAKKEELL